ncbi:MAG: ferrous iron transport protein A [Promethearchaeota archaeon]|nr:MAG: ferrous iron transport protein A [Candidatus Lokiarchaeota archaeon]
MIKFGASKNLNMIFSFFQIKSKFLLEIKIMISSRYKNHNYHKKRGTPLIKCLTECDKGEKTKVLGVNAGFGAKRRLANLGIVPGTIIKKKREAPFHGPLEIIVKGSTLAIGRGLASKILVECDQTCDL